jgi:hypothetical protein
VSTAKKTGGALRIARMPATKRRPTRRARRAMSEAQLIGVVEDSARDGSWNAAAWLLERRWPERWLKLSSRPSAAAPIPEPPEPLEPDDPDPFADVVELAKRRRQ